MNRQYGIGRMAAIVAGMACLAAGAAHGNTLYWATNNTPGTWDTVTANWVTTNGVSTVWTNGTNDVAVFSQLPVGVSGLITISGTVTVSVITVTNMLTANRPYTFTNGTINLTGSHLIQETTARDEINIYSCIAGTNGAIFAAYQDTLAVLNTNNAYVGGTTLRNIVASSQQGVYVGSDGSFGPVPSDGSGTNIILENAAMLTPYFANCTLHSNRTIALTGASGTIANRGGGTLTINGRILSTTASTINFSPLQYGEIVALGNTGSVYTATNVATAGFLQFNADNVLPTNTALRMTPGSVSDGNSGARLDMNGRNQTINGLFSSPVQTNGFCWICNGAANKTSTLTVAGTSSWGGQIRNGGPSGGAGGFVALTKSSGGTLTLAYTNIYTGPTTITGGTLALGANGTISSSTVFSVYAGGTFDVTNLTAFALRTNCTLKGGGVVLGNLNTQTNSALSPGLTGPDTLTVSGSVTVAGSYLADVDGALPASDRLTVASNLTLGATSALIVTATNMSAIAAAGFPRFTLASYGGILTGTFGSKSGIPANYTLSYGSGSNSAITLVGPGSGTVILAR